MLFTRQINTSSVPQVAKEYSLDAMKVLILIILVVFICDDSTGQIPGKIEINFPDTVNERSDVCLKVRMVLTTHSPKPGFSVLYLFLRDLIF